MGRISAARQLPLAAAAGLMLAACTQAPDMSGIAAERERSVKRYDISQAIAGNGKVIVVGTQSGRLFYTLNGGGGGTNNAWTEITGLRWDDTAARWVAMCPSVCRLP